MLDVFLVLMGLAGGDYHPAASPLISMSVEPGNRGRVGNYSISSLCLCALGALKILITCIHPPEAD